ncbi:MAG: DEAD/DEAH box helicase family protein [Legionellaceae bacterium]|nr:DEAD/DEAH box helicase family protein [Legionellaceae bacterium]
MPDNTYIDKGRAVRGYAQAALAIAILEQQRAHRVLEVASAQEIIEYHNEKERPKLMDLIYHLMNAPEESIAGGSEFVAVLGGEHAYQVVAKKMRDAETGEPVIEVKVRKELSQDKQEKFGLERVDFPPIMVKKGEKLKYSVTIEGKEVFNESSPKPRPLQLRVINKFADAMVRGNPQQLAIMGTGTGKSWVIAGVTHANGGKGVIVVPNDALAHEMKNDAIGILQGAEAKKSVHTSKEYETVEAFAEALEGNSQIILIADDPLFHEKAMAVQNTIVLMDESHQHTFDDKSLGTLRSLKEHNALLALTGTPTSKLKTVIGNDTLVDINVRFVMDQGGLRQNCRKTDANVLSTDLLSTAIKGYFARDEYPSKGPGLVSVDQVRNLIAGDPPMSEEAAIDFAMKKNCQRGLNQKNFVFTGDNRLRRDWIQSYQDIAEGHYPNEIILATQVRQARRDAEINARVEMMQALHPEADEEALYRIAEQRVGPGKPVNLVEEVKTAQQAQIAMSMNVHALSLLYPDVPARKLESLQRQGRLEALISTHTKTPVDIAAISYEGVATGLPTEQREKYIEQLQEIIERLATNPTDPHGLCTAADIDLEALQAQYTASATMGSKVQAKTTAEESAAILDQMRCGLVMHVASDSCYTTGISIPSVLGVQQIVASTADSLNNPVDAPQLHGRNIRADDLAAFNQQIVSNQVPEGQYVKLDDIYAEDSGKRMDVIFQAERDKASRMEAFSELKEQVSGRRNTSEYDSDSPTPPIADSDSNAAP